MSLFYVPGDINHLKVIYDLVQSEVSRIRRSRVTKSFTIGYLYNIVVTTYTTVYIMKDLGTDSYNDPAQPLRAHD